MSAVQRLGLAVFVLALHVGVAAAQTRPTADNAGARTPEPKKVTWKVGNVTREAIVYAPAMTCKKRPLVFGFHGHGGRAEFAARKFAFHRLWPDAVCVYPQGLPTPTPVIDPDGKRTGWQKYVGDQANRDVQFFDAMLKTLIAEYQIDEKRVYVSGHSNGGYFTYVLAVARGDKLAAIAPVAAALSLRDYANLKPVPVLHVAGKNDPLVKLRVQERTIKQVRQVNGCDPQGKPAGPWCTRYTSRSGPPVVAYVHPGRHEVPADAPKRIVQFFTKSE
jgi:polyhydroxybutyrate depolymerase